MELWDIFDDKGNPTGRTIRRGEKLNEGDYHLAVHIWIINDKGELLIQRRADHIALWPGMWATTGGSAVAGEDSITAALRETKEELGIQVEKEEMELIERIKTIDALADLWLLRKNIDTADIHIQVEEVSAAKWVNRHLLLKMVEDGQFLAYSYLPRLLERI